MRVVPERVFLTIIEAGSLMYKVKLIELFPTVFFFSLSNDRVKTNVSSLYISLYVISMNENYRLTQINHCFIHIYIYIDVNIDCLFTSTLTNVFVLFVPVAS